MANDDRENPTRGGRDEPGRPSPLSGQLSSSAPHPHRRHAPPLYGVIAEFETPGDLVHAARKVYEAGYRRINGYSPYPIEELSEAIGFGMQYLMEVIDYPLNVGGKPFNSWPAFIPITFECIVLAAAFSAVFGMLILNKLPQPYHPVFNTPNFALATRDRFFLAVEANDAKFDHDKVVALLQSLNAMEVNDVEV